jgi:hypothetical protein
MATVQNESRMPVSVLLDERNGPPKRSMSTEEQIVSAVRQAGSGAPVGEFCRLSALPNLHFTLGKRSMRISA